MLRRPRRQGRPPLRDAVVVLVGASSGIGRASALAFADHGARLVLAARGSDELDEVAAACRRRGADALAVPTDTSDATAVDALAATAVERHGRIDVWVQAASTMIAGRLDDHPADEARRLVETNVLGQAYGASAALRQFRQQGSGVLVLVSSLLGLFPNPLAPLYSASKFAVRGLALSLRVDVASEPDIDVCVVLPGPVDTPIFAHAADHTGRELRAIPPAMSAERLAATIVAAARRPTRQRTAGLFNRLLLVGHRITPRAVERGVAWWSATALTRTNEPADDRSGALDRPGWAGTVSGGYRLGRSRRTLGDALGRWLARRGSRSGDDTEEGSHAVGP